MSANTSDQDMSNCSSSLSYPSYSPHSSPSQQVPALANEIYELTGSDKNFQCLFSAGRPCLRITEQPQNHFRFRYASEVGTHGCLLGKTVGPNKQKTHPTVELLNYSRKALIRCRLAQHNNADEHPHKLLEVEGNKDMSYPVPDQGSYKVAFAGIGIIHVGKKDVPRVLIERYKNSNININMEEVKVLCDNMAKSIDLDIVRLKFSAHDRATGKEICQPVFSEPIHNMNNIMIRFFELDHNGERIWSSVGQFVQNDVHHQYAIVFRTPAYQNPETPVDVKVFIELVRPSDGRTSEPKEFTYKANQAYKMRKKRKAESDPSSGSLRSGCDIPISVTNHDFEVISMELEQLQMQISNNAPENSVSDELTSFLNGYLTHYDETLPEGANSMGFIRSSLVPDSGRAKPQVLNRFQGNRATNQNKLVKDLCGMIRNKEGFKEAELRAGLERLFEIRLSNGNTFLHMTPCTKLSTLEYIVKIIHSVKATHLLDCSNDMQQTTLHLAVLMDKPNIVSLFIAKGANPMLKDDEDLNVIHYAVKYRSCLEVLLDSIKENEVTCDLNDYNGEKQTALHMAVVSGWELGTRLLLQHGASFSVRDAEGRTPLHLAAYDDRLAVMKILLEFIPTIEIDVMDDAGNTALQIICGGTVRENSVEIARMLLEKKAYPLRHEDSKESAWRLVSKKPELRDLMKAYVTVGCQDEDDIKSESEDEYESADDGESRDDITSNATATVLNGSAKWTASL